jgi:hypothetical protein
MAEDDNWVSVVLQWLPLEVFAKMSSNPGRMLQH